MFSPIPGKVIHLHETDGKRVESVRYAVDKETLDTPMGKLETIVLTKQLSKDEMRMEMTDATRKYGLPSIIICYRYASFPTRKWVS